MVFLLEKDRIAAQKKIISILWLQYFVAWLGFHFYHPMMMHFYYRMNLETKCKTVKKNWSIYSSQAYVIRRKISRLQLINDIKRIWRIVYFALNFKHFGKWQRSLINHEIKPRLYQCFKRFIKDCWKKAFSLKVTSILWRPIPILHPKCFLQNIQRHIRTLKR